MIDFHNHVVPGLDDGSPNMDVSMKMIRDAAEQGITDVVNTVHYQHPKMDMIKLTTEDILARMESLQTKVDSIGINIKIHMGTEVFFLPNLLELIKLPLCTIGNGKYMLIEFQMRKLPETMREVLFDLKMAGVTPIIAHPERYKQVQENIHLINKWVRSGCLIQIDAGSLNGSLGKSAHKTAVKIVEGQMCHLMGSDAHDNRKRNFCLKEALRHVTKFTDASFCNLLMQNAHKVLKGEYIEEDVAEVGEKRINFFDKLKSNLWRKN